MADYLDGFNKKSTKAWEYLYRDYYTACVVTCIK